MERLTTALKHLLLLTFMFIGFITNAQIVYVDQGATGTGDGSSWANAFTDLQSAIDAGSLAGTLNNPIEIWVKADTYYPTSGTDRTVSFEIKDYVELYGGFSGTETLRSQRDFKSNHSILSGDIGVLSANNDNSFSVIHAGTSLTDFARIDGFHIVEAATVGAGSFPFAGGIAMVEASGELIIANCEVYDNDCSFGSGFSSFWSTSASARNQIINSIFYNNRTAVWTNREMTIANSMFIGNIGLSAAVERQNGDFTIVNSTFYDNVAGLGVTGQASNPTTEIYNCIFWNNPGNDIFADATALMSLTATNNIVEDGFSSGTNTITDDPLFFDGPNYDLRIQHCSPATDAGDDSFLDASITTDLSGDTRIFGSSIDLGAYENQITPLSFGAVEVGQVSCRGGSDGVISVNGSGGTGAPIHYSIDGVNFSTNSIFSGLSAGNYTVTLYDTGNDCTYGESFNVIEPLPYAVSVNPTAVTCNGDTDGKISGSVSGASFPYQLSLNGSPVGGQFTSTFEVSNLSAGTYNLTISDANGCVYTHPSGIIVSEPSAITGSTAVSDALCNGEASGEVTITASGGNAPLYYTLGGLSGNYSSSPVFNNLSAGNYVATVVDSKLCFLDIPFTIGEPSAISISLVSATDPSCDANSDGSISVSATGGTPSLFYSIDGVNFVASNTFNDLAAGTYTITVEDENGCRAEVTETLENQINLTLDIVSTSDVSCNGEADGEFEVSLMGGTAASYLISGMAPQTSGVFANLSAGSYTVIVQDTNGCTTTATVSVSEPEELELAITQTGRSFTLTASGGTSPYEYSNNGTTFQSTGSFSTLDPGAYTFTVRDANGCTFESNEFDVVLGITNMDVLIYPNPVSDVLKIEGVAFDELSIYNLTGQELLISTSGSVPVRGLTKGTYIIHLFKDQKEIHNQKLIVN
ncbi:T9SS type A sorting domain-containing protein [Ekhidna sp.]|jgi:hypothetical protein|uniref:T9SS type A sorting domain-containing protein n=1 Tax=Ekhidna sp. TaxID=2608089 RepID=UPI0032ED9D86